VSVVPYIGFALVTLAAIGFCTFALWRKKPKGFGMLAGAIALFLLGVGGGTYWMLGQPGLALRASQGLKTRDVKGLIPFLITRVRAAPNDEQAWSYLGRAYLSADDPDDAAKAYGRAITLLRQARQADPELDASFGEAAVGAANGNVTPQAEAAFTESLRLDPKNAAARYYLAQAHAMRGDKAGAISLLQSLLADVPTTAPLHQALVDRIAMLTAASGGTPDPRQMVAMLAAELKASPKDPAGWQRLIHAYTVLGQTAEAKDALATARRTFAADIQTSRALDAEAKELKLD
jgi:cytochrome c-type biogenesis protein CcmH